MKKGWSINIEDWQALEKVLLKSKTWKSVLLTTNEQWLVPEVPGVYAICARPPIGTKHDRKTLFRYLASPLYIGRSEWNIKSRFLKHCQNKNPQLRRAKHCFRAVQLNFWFIELPRNYVKDAEARLIKCFGPPVNEREGTISGKVKSPIDA